MSSQQINSSDLLKEPEDLSRKKVSIIMLVHNGKSFTKNALKTLYDSTNYSPCELILVDNASDKATEQWLLEEARDRGFIYLRNEENKGFVQAVNETIPVCHGEYICLVNNDVLFTEDWLSKLVNGIEMPKVGISTPLRMDGVTHQSVPKLIKEYPFLVDPRHIMKETEQWDRITSERYNKALEKDLKGRVFYTKDYVAFYCVLIKKELIDKIGLLDDRFAPGFGEDNDYCRRTIEAGYSIVVCVDTFVFHYAMATWRYIYPGAELQEAMEKGYQKYKSKYCEEDEAVSNDRR